jgi:hypothetical protein
MAKIAFHIPKNRTRSNRDEFIIAEHFFYIINKSDLRNPTILRTHFLTSEMANRYGDHNLLKYEVLPGTEAIELGVPIDTSEGLKHNKYVSINSILGRKRLRRFNKRRGYKISEYKVTPRFINGMLHSTNKNYPRGMVAFLIRYKKTYYEGHILPVGEWPRNESSMPWILKKLNYDYNKLATILRIVITLRNNWYIYKPYSAGKVAYYFWKLNRTRFIKWEKTLYERHPNRITRIKPLEALLNGEFKSRGFELVENMKDIKPKAILSKDNQWVHRVQGLTQVKGWALFYKIGIPGYTRILQ